MDIVIPLALMALMYLVPPLLRRYIEKKEVKRENTETLPPFIEDAYEESIPFISPYSPSTQITSNISDKTDLVKESSPWQGKLSEEAILNGVIFAEILQPPRAYRPFKGKLK